MPIFNKIPIFCKMVSENRYISYTEKLLEVNLREILIIETWGI